jgi:hypothetical protein
MKKNMGTADRIIRVVIAAIIGILYFTGQVPGTTGIILLVLAGVFVLTSLISFCPLYAPFGIRTCPVKEKNMPTQTTKSRIVTIFVVSASLLSMMSCGDDDDSSNVTQTQVQNNVKNGTWRITKFIDSGDDETNHFTGYNFTFNTSGVLNADNGTNSYDGSWSVTDNNSNDDSEDDLDFNINFNLTNDFEDLNDDWHFVSQSPTKIELIDVSGGNGGTDYLTFEKN